MLVRRAGERKTLFILETPAKSKLIIFFSYAHAREGKASKSASFAPVAISLITLTH
jgi:hypothetical protein